MIFSKLFFDLCDPFPAFSRLYHIKQSRNRQSSSDKCQMMIIFHFFIKKVLKSTIFILILKKQFPLYVSESRQSIAKSALTTHEYG